MGWPHLAIDGATIGLLMVAILPWGGGFLESFSLPGGGGVNYRKWEKQQEAITEPSEPGLRTEAKSQPIQLSENDNKILQALETGKYPLRSLGGITADCGKPLEQVAHSLNQLEAAGLAVKVEGRKGIRWALSPGGKSQLQAKGST